MLPPGCIILDSTPFFFYDLRKSNNKNSMNDVHYHNFFEVYLLLSGSCEYFIDDKIYSLVPNSLILIPKGIVHKTIYTSQCHERIVLNFSESFFNESLLGELQEIKFCSAKEYALQIFDNMSKVADYKHSNNTKNQILLTSYLNEILIYIIDNHINISKQLIEIPTHINFAVKYISEHYMENILLKDLSNKFGYSTDHFSKLFRDYTGSTFKEYLLLTRFSAAEKLLLTTKSSVTDIALSCGFGDSNYFSFMFHKRYGVSPLKYKKIKNNL